MEGICFVSFFSQCSISALRIANLVYLQLGLASSKLIVMPKAKRKSCGDCDACRRKISESCGQCKPCQNPKLKKKCVERICKSIKEESLKECKLLQKVPFVPEASENLANCILKQRVIAEVSSICEDVLGEDQTKGIFLRSYNGHSERNLDIQVEKIRKVFRKRAQFLYLSAFPLR